MTPKTKADSAHALIEKIATDAEAELQKMFPGSRAVEDATDAELRAEMDALGQERDGLEVPKAQPRAFVDDGHRVIDASVAAARLLVDAKLLDALQGLPATEGLIPTGFADAFVLAHFPEVASRWHTLLDEGMPSNRADPYRRDMTKAEYTAERNRLADAVAQRQAECNRRARAAKRAALDAEDAAAETTTTEEAKAS